MAAITTFLYRLGATAANIAQSVLQANGGGNGDPQVFDVTSKRATKPVVTAAEEPEESEKRHDR